MGKRKPYGDAVWLGGRVVDLDAGQAGKGKFIQPKPARSYTMGFKSIRINGELFPASLMEM